MNKVDLVRSAMERFELSRKDAVALVDGIFEDIEASVVAGEPVKIPGFGQFKVRDRAARIARNPATGEPVKVPAKRVFKFLPAKALKEAVMAKKGAKPAARKAAAGKAAASKAPVRKAAVSKAPARKAVAKAATRKAPARKAAVKKSSARKKR
ncbi:MAG TPA: HU family DNA-binding protein [Candidatus Dormibacteraeota bacterium]|nr:HU family DNA-binding protein [Candidatus Dormibacteraeota bacterium]